MKLRNVTSQAVQVFDEHAGRGALVEPGAETPELSELAYVELAAHAERWAPVDAVEKPAVRTSGRTRKGS
jgi:hypothetical protein